MSEAETSGIRQRPTEGKESPLTGKETSPSATTQIQSGGDATSTPRKKMLVRTMVGLPMVFFALATISSAYAHFIFSGVVFIIQIISFREVTNVRFKAAKEMKIPYFRTINWWFLFVTDYFLYGNILASTLHSTTKLPVLTFFSRYHIAISYFLYMIGFIIFVLSLKSGLYRYQFTQFAWTIMTLVFFVSQSNFIFYNIFEGLFWFVHPVSLIVCNDTFAYFVGMAMGRKFINRPFLKISPNKTWEGFIGGSICTFFWAYGWCQFLMKFPWVQCAYRDWNFETNACNFINPVFSPSEIALPSLITDITGQGSIYIEPIYIHAFVFTIFSSFIAPFGGFFASGMKRAHGLKDFDSIFPGHGGMTDRMDCQLIMALFVYSYFQTFIGTGYVAVSTILRAISQLTIEEQSQIFEVLKKSLNQ